MICRSNLICLMQTWKSYFTVILIRQNRSTDSVSVLLFLHHLFQSVALSLVILILQRRTVRSLRRWLERWWSYSREWVNYIYHWNRLETYHHQAWFLRVSKLHLPLNRRWTHAFSDMRVRVGTKVQLFLGDLGDKCLTWFSWTYMIKIMTTWRFLFR